MEHTSKGLVSWAEGAYDDSWVFWYGTHGQTCTLSLLKQMKTSYPSKYTKIDLQTMKKHIVSGKSCCDSIGLVKSYIWYDGNSVVYNGKTDMSSERMYNSCNIRSTYMSRMPEEPGLLLFSNDHTGIYIGNGVVIHAKSIDSGIVRESIYESEWFKWGYCPFIDYTVVTDDSEDPVDEGYVPLPEDSVAADVKATDEIYKNDDPPVDPEKDPIWMNTSVSPIEVLKWKYANVPSIDRTYDSTLTGNPISFNNTLGLLRRIRSFRTILSTTQTGTPSPSNIIPIAPSVSEGDTIEVSLSMETDGNLAVVDTYEIVVEEDMYGMSSYEDNIDILGYKTHKTVLISLDGSETISVVSVGTVTVKALVTSGPDGLSDNTPSICSHFVKEYSEDDESHFYRGITGTYLFVPKSVLLSYDSSGVSTWLSTNDTNGTPVQVLYALEDEITTETTEQADPEDFFGSVIASTGVISIEADSASTVVDYTGSGWSTVNNETGLESRALSSKSVPADPADITTTETQPYTQTQTLTDEAYCPVDNALTAIISNPNTVPDDLLPRVGDIVWILFENGDINKPVCIGTLAPDNDTVQNVINKATYPSLGGGEDETDSDPIDGPTDVNTSDLYAFAVTLVADNESSSEYNKIKWNIGGASSIGLLQWKQDAAKDLLNEIRKDPSSNFEAILEQYSATSFLNDLKKPSWVKYKIGSSENSNICKAVKQILMTDAAKAVQDRRANSNIKSYVERGKSCDITNKAALLYFCDICHIQSSIAKEVARKSSNNLDSIHSQSLKNTTFKKSLSRRNTVYKKIKEFLNIQDPVAGDSPSTGDAPTTGTGMKKPVDYKQFDSRWGKKPFGGPGRDPMSAAGCSVTAIADILATWCDKSVNPWTVAQICVERGYRASSGIRESFFVDVAKSERYKKYFSNVKTTGSISAALAALRTGRCLVIAHVKEYLGHAGHYVLLWKTDSSYIAVNDPGSSKEAAKRIPISYMKSKAVKYFVYYKK